MEWITDGEPRELNYDDYKDLEMDEFTRELEKQINEKRQVGKLEPLVIRKFILQKQEIFSDEIFWANVESYDDVDKPIKLCESGMRVVEETTTINKKVISV